MPPNSGARLPTSPPILRFSFPEFNAVVAYGWDSVGVVVAVDSELLQAAARNVKPTIRTKKMGS